MGLMPERRVDGAGGEEGRMVPRVARRQRQPPSMHRFCSFLLSQASIWLIAHSTP